MVSRYAYNTEVFISEAEDNNREKSDGDIHLFTLY